MPVIRPGTPPEYQAALDYIYSFINYENKMPPSPEHARFNLDRMRRLLADLGDPQNQYKTVLIAGTKGKGSTSAMIESMLRAGGYRAGLFSSPHLHTWRERIQVNRELIAQDDMVRLVERIKPIVDRLPPEMEAPTVFELATAIALVHFAEAGVDVAVLEIGMGGRYDSVNVVTPDLSVITPISFDHTAILGSTLPEIAHAKAGIVKAGVPAIIGPQAPEAAQVIVAEADRESSLWQAEHDRIEPLANVADGARPYPLAIGPEQTGLRGSHQVENARLAVGAVMLLAERGLAVPVAAMRQGLASVQWPGRFEVVPGKPAIVIDGAMNGASSRRLREALFTLPHRRLFLVLGTSRDKDIAAIAAELVPGAAATIVTRSRHPRSADPEAIATEIEPFLDGVLYITGDIATALDNARLLAGPDDLICVAGSLFVAAEAREALDLDAVID